MSVLRRVAKRYSVTKDENSVHAWDVLKAASYLTVLAQEINALEGHELCRFNNPGVGLEVNDLRSPVLPSERITQLVGEYDSERKGLMLCCMRTAERYGDMQGGRGRHVQQIPKGTVINCAKCGQEIESLGGQAWKAK